MTICSSYLIINRRDAYSKSEVNADEEMNRVFKVLASQENDTVRPRTITHLGRDLTFQRACGQVLDSSFDELCDRVSVLTFFPIKHFKDLWAIRLWVQAIIYKSRNISTPFL